MKTLVIVESSTKAKTIEKYLNSSSQLVTKYGSFTVTASMGHIMNLRVKDLSIDIDAGFKPVYEVMADKAKLISELGKKIKSHDLVLLASDHDREGEAIAWHLREHYKLKQGQCKRILFNEITKNALVNAVNNAGVIDTHMVDAQQARRVLDRLVGYKISPLLWKYYKTSGTKLSAGRVQSAVLNIICKKERDVAAFESQPYWSCEGEFKSGDITVSEAKLYINGGIYREPDSGAMVNLLKRMGQEYSVANCVSKTKRVKPDAPFITSSLQQEAYNKLGMGVGRTMKIAQDLYERGHITYMRTDSYTMSADACDMIREYVVGTFGDKFFENEARVKAKGAHAQEAHECIRPTAIKKVELEGGNGMTSEHSRLYDMIWKRTVASRMTAAVYHEVGCHILNDLLKRGDMMFIGKFKKLDFEGYLAVYGMKPDKTDLGVIIEKLSGAKMVCREMLAHNTWTSPPSRFNESNIIRTLEAEGIGRPSTYAGIMSKLYDKQYVQKLDTPGTEKQAVHYVWNPTKKKLAEKRDVVYVGKENSRIIPSTIGTSINEFMEQYFAHIVDSKFTALMEDHLDHIADGKESYLAVLSTFWEELEVVLKKLGSVVVKGKDKTSLQNSSIEIAHKGITYVCRVTRYGPVIQRPKPDGTQEYFNIKAYLKIVGKDYVDMTMDDVDFVTSLPYDYGGKIVLKLGPYGLYLQQDGEKNYRIPGKYISKMNLRKLFDLDDGALKQITSFKKSAAVAAGKKKAS